MMTTTNKLSEQTKIEPINSSSNDHFNYLEDLKETKEMCSILLQSPHYKSIGVDGIFAIVQTAKSLGIDPRLALGGGLYYVKGKVEMSSRMMAAMIRSKRHSITRDSRSNDDICILHGKRADNGDCWSESFSIKEASRAGLTSSLPWRNFQRDMLYARALSRLARQLFPDVIGNCYVEGEISLDVNIQKRDQDENAELPAVNFEESQKKSILTMEKYKELTFYLDKVPEYKKKIEEFVKKQGFGNLWNLPEKTFEIVLSRAKQHVQEAQKEDTNADEAQKEDTKAEESPETKTPRAKTARSKTTSV